MKPWRLTGQGALWSVAGMRVLLPLLLCVLLPLHASAQVTAATPAPAPITPAQARQVLDVLQDDAKRAQFVAVLENMAKAMPAPAATIPTPLRPDGVGAQVLEEISSNLGEASKEVVATIQAVTDFPLLVHWVGNLGDDPNAMTQLLEIGWKLLLVLAVGGAAEALMMRALRRLRRAIDNMTDESGWHTRPADTRSNADDGAEPGDEASPAHAIPVAPDAQAGGPDTLRKTPATLILLRRIPYVLARMVIDLIPVASFAAVAIGLLGTPIGKPAAIRLVILALVNAYLLCRLAICASRLLVSPVSPRLRLVHMSDRSAAYVMVWARRLSAVAACGYGLSVVAAFFGLYPSAQDALIKVVALIDHMFLVVIVLQCRHAVATRIAPREGAHGLIAILRRRLAATWHYIAIFYIVALWLVWALEVRDGFSRLLHFFIVTVVVLTLTRLVAIVLLGGLDRLFHLSPDLAARYPALEARAGRYHPLMRAALNVLITVLATVALFEAWGLDPVEWFVAGALGGRLVSAAASVVLTLSLALAVWEITNAAIERRLDSLSRDLQAARSARLRTLLPMLRTTLFITIVIVAGLMVLSQLGVNISPLLAGAGVIGVAVGFGSQKLVQDIITGLFLLLENAMQVGDIVTLASLTGTVEYLSIRTIRLRAQDGSVHIIPFSAVTSVTNMTRDYNFAMLDVEVGFNEEPDVIADVLRDVAGEMREEPEWKLALLADIEVLGVENFTDNAWVMRVRIRTQPSRRWAVQRELNRRIKYRFDKLAIESPFTSHRILSTMPGPASPAVPEPQPTEMAVPVAVPSQATA